MAPVARTRTLLGASLLLGLALLAVACSSTSGLHSPDPEPSGSLSVAAAASLTAAFTAMEAAFEEAHPDVAVTISYGSSSTLAQQINEGAPFDVFAAADEANMTKVERTGGIGGTATIFATNTLQIIVPKGNPANIRAVSDLARPGVTFVTCGPNVPIGAYTVEVLRRAGVVVTPASLEPDVKGIVAKVTSGEADAGIVYATDVTATRGAGEGIDIPSTFNVVARYPIATLSDSRNRDTAVAWIAFVTGTRGRQILTDLGFGVP